MIICMCFQIGLGAQSSEVLENTLFEWMFLHKVITLFNSRGVYEGLLSACHY